ncbi:hypothetical protein ASG33_21220 [Dyadobacter sp. Leaf189]|nr:hypothetical protein ASG33_21220 [Dyadobacter sp. Leaf189]
MRKKSIILQVPAVYARLIHLARLAAVTAMSQATIQALGLLTGFLIIHLLPVKEYAYYTIANTVLGTMALLSDSGINNGVMAQGGRVWEDRAQLGAILAAGLTLRKRFSAINLCISIPILLFLLLRQGAGWPASLLIVLALVPAFVATLTDSILEIPFKLQQEVRSLQVNQLVVGAGRFLLSAGLLLLFPLTAVSLLANGIPRVYGNSKLRQRMHSIADLSALPDPAAGKELLKTVRRVLPLTVYYAYSSQIAVWIVSLSGSAFAVAQLGALGRISMILSLFSILFATMITPRFARMKANRSDLLRRFLQILLLLLVLIAIILSAAFLFSGQVLQLLGPKYTGLDAALILSLAAASINLLSGAVYGLYSSRSWTMQPMISIGLNLSCVLICMLLLDVSTLRGVLWFNVCCALVQMLIALVFCTYKIAKMPVTGNTI